MITNAEFAARTGWMASVISNWSAGALALRDKLNEPMRDATLERFIAEMRERIDHLERDAGLRVEARRGEERR